VAVSNWFIRRRPTAIGYVAVSQRVGMATLPVFAAVVISWSGDWRMGWLALAGVAITLGVIPPALFIRRRPEDMGLRPDGDPPPAARADGTPAAEVDEGDFTLREAVRTRAYWFLGIAVGLLLFTGGSMNFHQIPYLRDQALGGTAAASIVSVFSIFGAAGGLIGGFFASRMTARWVMVASLVGMSVGPMLLLLTDTYPVAVVYAVVYGLFFGATVAMNQAIYADYFGRTSLGVIRGSFQPVQMVLNAAGPFLTGLWVDWAGSYNLPFLVFSACLLGAAGLLLFAPVPERSRVSGRAP
jgi:MFS family permease